MSLLFGSVEKRQGWTSEPPILPAGGTSRGLGHTDLSRADNAMQKVAVYASVNLLASLASMIPIDCYVGTGADKREVAMPSWLTDPEGAGHGLADWLYQSVYSTALRGNFIGRIMQRDRYNKPTQIVPQHPDRVTTYRDPKTGRPVWRFGGDEVPTEDVFHRRAFPIPGRLMGMSPVALHALTIGQGLSAAQFGLQWFQDGAHPSGMLVNADAKEITAEAAVTLKARFLAAIRGTREPVVMAGGWRYEQIQVAAGESQFLETQRYTASECARIYGPGMPEMLGYETGNGMTYSNVEQRSLDLLTYTVDPWFVRAERMLSDLLPGGMYVKFNRKALLRTDAMSRFAVHQIGLENQITTVNEVRDHEDMPRVPWGDRPVPHIKPDITGKMVSAQDAGPAAQNAPLAEGSHNIVKDTSPEAAP